MSPVRERPRRANVLPARARVYLLVLVAVTLVLAPLTYRFHPVGGDSLVPIVLLSMLSAVGSSWGLQRLGRAVHLHFGGIVLLAAIVLTGPFGAMVVGASVYAFELGHRPRLSVRVFNTAMTAVTAGLSGLVYTAVGGLTMSAYGTRSEVLQSPSEVLRQIGLPFLVADVAACTLNVAMLGGIIRFTDDEASWRRFVVGQLMATGRGYIGYGIIGFLLVVLWWPAGVGALSALLIVSPLFVANYAFQQQSGEQEAHERTLGALVTAVEVKDPYTSGHSERVARLCRLIAGAMSISQQETEALHYAGLLHDIGKLAIPASVLRKPDGLTEEDLSVVADHPIRGVAMLRDIEFLQPSLPGIHHHHERVDGLGYPDGLVGEDIPIFARILAVADAFDSLTTSKLEREAYSVDDALVELHRRTGTHLDASVVAALERSLARHQWEPTILDPLVLATIGRAFDHDDPTAADLMAKRYHQPGEAPAVDAGRTGRAEQRQGTQAGSR
ncbi:MAG TPA: HD-GYP domain-containing protein [Dermatophilaceae bacterium]|nr:HD-GYP domain-containing protein [Dermatophilaceae bacterium]